MSEQALESSLGEFEQRLTELEATVPATESRAGVEVNCRIVRLQSLVQRSVGIVQKIAVDEALAPVLRLRLLKFWQSFALIDST